MSNRIGLADPANFERFCAQWQELALHEAEAWTQDPEVQLLLSEAVLGDLRHSYANRAPSNHMEYFIKGQTCLVYSKTGRNKALLAEHINAHRMPDDPGPHRMTESETEKLREPEKQTAAYGRRRRPAQESVKPDTGRASTESLSDILEDDKVYPDTASRMDADTGRMPAKGASRIHGARIRTGGHRPQAGYTSAHQEPVPRMNPRTPVSKIAPQSQDFEVQESAPQTSRQSQGVAVQASAPQTMPQAQTFAVQTPVSQTVPQAQGFVVQAPVSQTVPQAQGFVVQAPVSQTVPQAQGYAVQAPVLQTVPQAPVIRTPQAYVVRQVPQTPVVQAVPIVQAAQLQQVFPQTYAVQAAPVQSVPQVPVIQTVSAPQVQPQIPVMQPLPQMAVRPVFQTPAAQCVQQIPGYQSAPAFPVQTVTQVSGAQAFPAQPAVQVPVMQSPVSQMPVAPPASVAGQVPAPQPVAQSAGGAVNTAQVPVSQGQGAQNPGNQGQSAPAPAAQNPGNQGQGAPAAAAQNPGNQGQGAPAPAAPNPGNQGQGTPAPATQNPGNQGQGAPAPAAQNQAKQGQGAPAPAAQNPAKPAGKVNGADTFLDPNRSSLWLPKSLGETQHVVENVDLPDDEEEDNRSMFLSMVNTILFIVMMASLAFFVYSTGVIQHFFF